MVSTVEQVERELNILHQAIATLSEEFHQTYSNYLETLGQAVRQQLIQASYYLCTRGYPNQFLKLSLSQQQQIQKALRQLGTQAQADLLERLKPIEPWEPRPPIDFAALAESLARTQAKLESAQTPQDPDAPESSSDSEDQEGSEEGATQELPTQTLSQIDLLKAVLASSLASSDGETDEDDLDDEDSDENDDEFDDDFDGQDSDPQEIFNAIFNKAAQEESGNSTFSASAFLIADADSLTEHDPQPTEPRPLNSQDLLHWQESLEQEISTALQDISHQANRQLQQSSILPKRLPEPVLEVAAKADLASEAIANQPNLLNLLIKSSIKGNKESVMTQVMAIRLRLSEIEFSNANVIHWRSKIRGLSTQLNKLHREYQKKQKEKAIAQAEAAWRSSWFED
jgi:hypothetical protein